MDLVFHQVGQLEHQDDAHGHRLVKALAGLTVEQRLLAQRGQRVAALEGNRLGASKQVFTFPAVALVTMVFHP